MLEGEISQINLVERLVELWREQFTGAIRFENDGIIKIVYCKGGDILSASTNDRADSVDEILMRAGKVSREHVKQAVAKRKESETLGDALLNLGFITRKELMWARRVQVVGVIRSIVGWSQGSFTIVADYLPKRDEGTIFPVPQVIVELIVTDQDRARFEQALEGGSVVFARTPDFDDVWRRLALNEDAEAIVAEIDGQKSASDIATASGRDTFNVYKLLDALATLGVLTRIQSVQAQQFALDDFAGAGVADAADMWNQQEPTPVAVPSFELDEVDAAAQPTLEIPSLSFEEPEVVSTPAYAPAYDAPSASSSSAWDREEKEAVPPVAPAPARVPAWDAPPREPIAIPIPATIEPPAEPEKEQWGFDEAQLETARRAAAPPAITPTSAPKVRRGPVRRERSYAFLVTLMVLFILAGAGYFGFRWWQTRQAIASADTTKPAAPKPPTPVPASTATVANAATVPTTGTTAASGVVSAPISSSITPPQAAVATPGPAVVTPPQTAQVLPRVTPKPTPGRERYDAMARTFAANASGNFTVQIQILCETSNLEAAMRVGGDNLWFVPQTIGSRSCYRVFWGHYATREEAQRALASLPPPLRDRSASVKAIPKG